MEVWIKPELIIDEMVLSQHYAGDCAHTDRYWEITCTAKNSGHAKVHVDNQQTTSGGTWFDISITPTQNDMISVLNSLHDSGNVPNSCTKGTPVGTNQYHSYIANNVS